MVVPLLNRLLKRLAILGWCLAAKSALALNPDGQLASYHHATWTARDGIPGSIWTMAQTPDGWLWLGTNFGLYRFDGTSFERYTAPAGARLLGDNIRSLLALENGDLLIGYEYGGLTVRHRDGTLAHLTGDKLRSDLRGINQIARDPDGSLWLATASKLHRYANGKLLRYGPEQGFTGLRAGSIVVDGTQVWVSDLYDVFLLDRASNRFQKIGKAGLRGRGGILMSPNGQIWFETYYGESLVRLSDTANKPRPPLSTAHESHGAAMFDRHGSLWQVGPLQGVSLLAGAQSLAGISERDFSDKFDQPWQLSSLSTTGLLEDRLGNIWISTMAGLERLRHSRLQAVRGIPGIEPYSVANDVDGNTWAATPNAPGLWRLPGDGGPAVHESEEPYGAVATARDGALLLATKRFLERRDHGKTTLVAFPEGPDGQPRDWIATRIIDDGERIWVYLNTLGLLALTDGRWVPATQFGIEAGPTAIVPGRKGQLWLGYGDGRVVSFDNGRQQTYATELGAVIGLRADAQEVIAGGERGLAVLQSGRFQQLTASNPDVLRFATGMAVTVDGDRWFNAGKGVVHVRLADWRYALASPAAPLRYELIDSSDGYVGQTATMSRLPSIGQGPQGSLLFMTSVGLLRLPSNEFQKVHPAPFVEILRLRHHGQDEQSRPGLKLPPGTDNFSIAYTALELGRPQHVRFQYQLDGIDSDWQDAAERRVAYYTNIAPGNYLFRVRAAVDNGPWSDGKAEMAFTVLPTLTQTLWFRAACVLTLLILLWRLYIYRMRVVTRRLEERFVVRTKERERIARTLHDTIIQSMQAVILRLHVIGLNLPVESKARHDIDHTLEQAEKALVEGRDEVQGLRDGKQVDLGSALEEIGRSAGRTYCQAQLRVDIEGEPRSLTDGLAHEILAIASEAITNACRHAAADGVTAQVIYAKHCFTLAVRDDGRGIPPMILHAGGKEGHWGMAGMRERAQRVGGTLRIESGAGSTAVTLQVPARAAYKRNRRLWRG
ncbi:triple tyrosine motif-containing protein [Pseudoduganella sp. UC29_106]|uniref:sensor histidine kinase n=1 Tax=Pseudoduganella sp. UC29_106 TaxID=3374553 RepID=UPI00375722A4